MLLTKAGMVDPRMRRTDPRELADRAEAWAEVLVDVAMADALEAMRAHYRESSDALMPSDVVERCAPVERWDVPDVTDQVVEESRLRALEAAGVTEAEFEARKGDRAWVLATFPVERRELTYSEDGEPE